MIQIIFCSFKRLFRNTTNMFWILIFPIILEMCIRDRVCHVFDRFVMRYHNDRIAIFLIDILDQLQYFF